MVDGPIYRDIKDPNAVLVHIFVENMVRAGQWFQSEPFKETDRRYTTVCRDFYWRSSRKLIPAPAELAPPDEAAPAYGGVSASNRGRKAIRRLHGPPARSGHIQARCEGKTKAINR